MDAIGGAGGGNVNSSNEIGAEFDTYIGDNVCGHRTVISDGCIKTEPYQMEAQLEDIHSDLKDENIDEPMVAMVGSQEDDLTAYTRGHSFIYCKVHEKFDDCVGNKICVYETDFLKGFNKQEQCDAKNQLEGTHTQINMKQEIIMDPMVVSQETELTKNTVENSFIYCQMQDEFNDYTDNKICIYETAISGGYNKQEQCDVKDQQWGTRNLISIKPEIRNNMMVTSQDIKLATDTKGNSFICYDMLKNFNDCADNKICGYGTTIGGGHNEQKQCDVVKQVTDTQNHGDINHIIQNSMAVLQGTKRTTDTKENIPMYCEECGEEYDLYCLKCHMLIRIFDGNKPNTTNNSLGWTLPRNFIDIHRTHSGVGVIALRAIPAGVVFGPFDGLSSIKDGAVSKWKLKNKKLVSMKDLRWLNWMQFIRAPNQRSNQNLIAFQYENELYCRSNCHISVGDELLVCWDGDSAESAVRDTEYSYWKPRVCERLPDTYACTFCCVGYKSICHLAAHNSRCPEKRNQGDFCKEIIQCAFCKIYLDEKECLDFHMEQCFESKINRTSGVDNYKCSMCEYGTSQKDKFDRHQQTHGEKHAHVDSNRNRFKCQYCGKEFSRVLFYVAHQRKEHSLLVYKCDRCAFETTNRQDFTDHLATYNDGQPYWCRTCGRWFKSEKTRYYHFSIFHQETKKYKCSKCDFETIHKNCVRRHILVKHGHRQQFKCTRCPFKTRFKGHFEHHLRAHKGLKSSRREPRKLGFWSTRLRSRHKKEVHRIIAAIYNCRNCNYCTRRKWEFEKHRITCPIRNDVQPDTSNV